MTTKEKLEKAVKLADAMYYAAQSMTTDASRLHKAMEEYHQFIITEYNKQEPASEEEKHLNYIKDMEELIQNNSYDCKRTDNNFTKNVTFLFNNM